MQEKTNTLIKVPRINEIGDVKIEGGTERDVVSCKNQIQMVLFNRREKMPVTHFLSIPIISDEVKNNFNKFKVVSKLIIKEYFSVQYVILG